MRYLHRYVLDCDFFSQVQKVRLKTKFTKARGNLYVTTTHLIFVDPDCATETWVTKLLHCVVPARDQPWMLFSFISRRKPQDFKLLKTLVINVDYIVEIPNNNLTKY